MDVRPILVRNGENGFINKSKHIQVNDLFKEGKLVHQEKILNVFYWAGVSKDEPIIFYGGDDAYVLKAIADHAGFMAKT